MHNIKLRMKNYNNNYLIQDELTKFIKQSYMPGFSYNKKKEKVNDILIQKYITEVIADEFGQHYGYKKVTAVLKRKYSLIINKKKVYRLMKVMNVLKNRTERVRKYKKNVGIIRYLVQINYGKWILNIYSLS